MGKDAFTQHFLRHLTRSGVPLVSQCEDISSIPTGTASVMGIQRNTIISWYNKDKIYCFKSTCLLTFRLKCISFLFSISSQDKIF